NFRLPDERPRFGKSGRSSARARLPASGDTRGRWVNSLQYMQHSRIGGAKGFFATGGISRQAERREDHWRAGMRGATRRRRYFRRSEEHTSELQSPYDL